MDLQARKIRIWADGERLRVKAPKGALTSALREELKTHKAEILRFLGTVSEERRKASELPLVPLASDERCNLPLSYDQQRMWLIHQLDPEGSAYNLHLNMTLNASQGSLQYALNLLSRRHEILRTTYRMGELEPEQVIHDAFAVELSVVDLSGLDSEEQQQVTAKRSDELAKMPFDLEKGPVWRALAMKLGERLLGLTISIHHIASDGWSLDFLGAEIRELCHAAEEGVSATLQDLPVQYADYALWQRQWMQGEILENQLSYWRERLAGMPEALELMTDYPRPKLASYSEARHLVGMPRPLNGALREIARSHHVTLFMMLLTLFKALLSRYSGQEDIVVGTPIAGRTRPEVENVQGLFVNNLVLRTDMGGDISFSQAVERVRETTLGAYAHQNLPFQILVDAIQPQRDPSRNPLFQVLFTKPIVVKNDADSEKPESSGGMGAMGGGLGELDLALWVIERDEETLLSFVYNADLFHAETIQRMGNNFLSLAQAVVDEPDQPLWKLPMLSAEERRQLLEEWNRTEQLFTELPASRLFEARAASTPDATALVFKDKRLTYSELDAHANRLAHYLVEKGAGAEVTVALFVDRGFDMIISIFGVLKSGAAYVPLDPAYPEERLAFMLKDSSASILVSQQHLLKDLPAHSAVLIDLVDDAKVIEEQSSQVLLDAPAGADLAYIIYTSGSTGLPKGVEVPNNTLANLLQAMTTVPGMNSDDVMIAITTLSFDMAVPELYLPLISGATMIIADRDVATDGLALGRLIDTSGTTVFQATPSTWRLLFASGWKGNGKLKALCGAEPMPLDLADLLIENCGSVWNMYGPTETTVWSTAYRLTREAPLPLIGRPLANTTVYILDRHREPVPVGIAGELYIGGSGVTRGYLQRPELTEERYLENCFTPGQGKRLYRTGDLARYRQDGNIEHLGRMDFQVKLRGYRIELGEIEAALTRQESVHNAVVMVREDKPGDQRLVAYVILSDAVSPVEDLNEAHLRSRLRAFLPAYMIPSIFVFVESFPLTPSGKVDRKALPAPGFRRQGDEGYIAPCTELEKKLSAIWCEVLDIDRVSIDSNFFDIGGHSLLAINAIVRFKEQTGKILQPVDFYQQTLAQLAAGVDDEASHQPAQIEHSILLDPEYFGEHERRLFGLARKVDNPRGVGVVLCHPHAHEYNRSHRAMRELGMRLANNGFNTFSFDYFGTGDSAGDYEDARFTTWIDDINTAVDYFKKKADVDRICLVGMRIGATLAYMAAAKREDVGAIAMWDPVVTHEDITGETLEIKAYQELNPVSQRDIKRTDVIAYAVTENMLNDLEQVDLMSLGGCHADHLLVLEATAVADDHAWTKQLAGDSTRVDYIDINEPRVWMREQYESIVPQEIIKSLVSWVSGVCA